MPEVANPLDGVRIHYQVTGDGPPMFLFHGTATSGALWRATGYVSALKARRTLLLIDARGHGDSDKPTAPDEYRMDLLVADVGAVLDDAGVDDVDYLGYSFGGRVGLGFALAAPLRVRSLMLGGASHRPQAGALERVFYPGYLDILKTQGVESFLRGWSDYHNSEIPAALRRVFLAADPAALVPYLRQTEQEPGYSDERLRTLQVPTLLFAGEHDDERLADSKALAELLPNADVTVIPGRDHFTTLASAPRVLPAILEFLDRQT